MGRKMAGPGIRAFHFARELSKVAPTALVASAVDVPGDIEVVDCSSAEARLLVRDATLVISQPSRLLFSLLAESGATPIFDLFDPTLVELDELLARKVAPRIRLHRFLESGRLLKALRTGAVNICATPQQRSYYEAHAARHRITRQLEWLIVPFGVEDGPISADTAPDGVPLFIWNGGRWPWLDPALAADSVRRLNRSGVRCRLLLLGGARPNEEAPQTAIPNHDDDLIEQNADWVAYRDRGRWLRRARAAVILHRVTPEAEVSIRTRFFDALWAGLPVIASRGGWVSDLIEREKLGIVVTPERGDEVESAMRRMIEDDVFHLASVSNLERIRPQFTWSRVVAPLAAAARKLINA